MSTIEGNPRLVLYQMSSGFRVAIVRDSDRKDLRVVILDTPIDVRRVPATEAKYMKALEIPTLSAAAKRFRRAGKKQFGISKNARSFLRGL